MIRPAVMAASTNHTHQELKTLERRFQLKSASLFSLGAGLLLTTSLVARVMAQLPPGPGAAPVAGPAANLLLPPPLAPPQNFATSTEHYHYLYKLHHGGTRHTRESVPNWEGLWSPAGNTITGQATHAFLNNAPAALAGGGEVKTGILSSAYEAAFRKRRENMLQFNEQPYDRLTTCEPAGYPRWLLEPYVREFVNTPGQSWWLNDLGNDTRRIYIGQEHRNVDATHSAEGDSVGFWAGDMLVVHTIEVWPGDWFRGMPPTSNQMESVEIWRMETFPNGERRLVANVTFYDSISLLRPLTGVYTFRRNIGLEDAGYRIRHWDCDSNENTYLTSDGRTNLRLPGDAGFRDIRGSAAAIRNPDLPPDLPGQERDPKDVGLSLENVVR
jgi:hypothetical protein